MMEKQGQKDLYVLVADLDLLQTMEKLLTRISILALARSQYTPALPRIPRLSALNPAHHLRRQAPKPVRPLTDVDGAG